MPEPTRGSQVSLSDSISQRGSQASLRSSASNDSTASSDSARAETPKITMGGLEVVFLEPLDKKYECVMCTQVLRYPVQFESCGHYCCSSCLSELCRWVCVLVVLTRHMGVKITSAPLQPFLLLILSPFSIPSHRPLQKCLPSWIWLFLQKGICLYFSLFLHYNWRGEDMTWLTSISTET